MQPKTPLFTSGSQHPPRFGHAVYLGEVKHVKSGGRPFFGPHGHNLNKLGRGSLDDATYILSRL